MRFVASVKTAEGVPVSGTNVVFSSDSGGTFSPVTGVTIWDGTALSTYVMPNVNYGVTVTATCGTITDRCFVPIGKAP